MKTCSIEGCGGKVTSRGYCNKHYIRFLKYGNPYVNLTGRGEGPKPCVVEGCDRFNAGHGLCKKHYDRMYFKKRRLDAEQWAKRKAAKVRYRQTQRGHRNAISSNARRKDHVKQATPPWVNIEDINTIYQTCPPDHHVDHIIPLRGENVCGLHVPWNLRHLPASENILKGNRLREEDLRLIEAV